MALPGAPGFERTGFELTGPARDAGVKVVILVASVFRRTSYKRRPDGLYGADDYVEIHHLGDHLPNRLRAHLGLADPELPSESLREVLGTLNERGDDHLGEQTPHGLATLIVADLLLYNGDRITEAGHRRGGVRGRQRRSRGRPRAVRSGPGRTSSCSSAT